MKNKPKEKTMGQRKSARGDVDSCSCAPDVVLSSRPYCQSRGQWLFRSSAQPGNVQKQSSTWDASNTKIMHGESVIWKANLRRVSTSNTKIMDSLQLLKPLKGGSS